jgi:hypothetical protein
MSTRLLAVGALLLALSGLSPVAAHHSVSGQFDVSKPMTLTGTISKVDWINPHIYVHLDVKSDKGAVTTWALATLPTAMMRRSKITKASLAGKPGETVTIRAVPARDGTKHLGWINKITYSDGRYLQLAGQ